uniref:POF1B actin binding protein n=1 Tax=Athene cunicularia TaxID=194338 RepID=A0A663MRR0_ATHCN
MRFPNSQRLPYSCNDDIAVEPSTLCISSCCEGSNLLIYSSLTTRRHGRLNTKEKNSVNKLQISKSKQNHIHPTCSIFVFSFHPEEGISIMTFLHTFCQVNCSQENSDQLDCRYFGELLAELNRKTNDLYSCLLQHTEEIEDLIPKGLSEATKQQIRYLLQMRVTSDKSLRLVLSTFKNLREELCHLQDDLGKLETDSVLLKKDLAFKDSQVKEYETMLTSLRENNRQQQQGLRDSTARCRSLEEQLLSLRLSEGEKDCQLKELEYCKRALEQEIQNLRLQVTGSRTCSNPTLQTTTDELSSRYVEMINNLREDKDREIRSLRSQLCQFQQDISRREGSNSDLQMRLHELTSMLEEKDACIKQQQEELFRLKHDKLSGSHLQVCNSSSSRYRNQYPILGLLSDDYKVPSPVNKSQTIVIERTGEIWKHVSSPRD